MKNAARKIIAISLGVCFFAIWFVFLFFIVTKPYTKKVIIWLPDHYKLENVVSDEVVSIIPNSDAGHQSNKVFYSQIDIELFKNLFGNSEAVTVRIEDMSYPNRPIDGKYGIVYQTKFDCIYKFIVVAQEVHDYNKKILSEMRLKDGVLFLKNKRDENKMFFLSISSFIFIAVLTYLLGIDVDSKQKNN